MLAATATLFAAKSAAAQTAMSPQEAAAFRADWQNRSRCPAARCRTGP